MTKPPMPQSTDIVLDLPPPPSVNRLRKIDWPNSRVAKKWALAADKFVLAARCRSHNPVKCAKLNRFEILIVLSEAHSKCDLDNVCKGLLDYLCRIEIIEDDGPNHLRRLTVEWGTAPDGCRVTIRPFNA
jgi:Holliday junction resolvase RusA-like endonuclease